METKKQKIQSVGGGRGGGRRVHHGKTWEEGLPRWGRGKCKKASGNNKTSSFEEGGQVFMAGAGQHKGQWPLKWKGQAEAEHRGPRTRSRFYSEHNWVPLKDWKQERDVIFLKIKRREISCCHWKQTGVRQPKLGNQLEKYCTFLDKKRWGG